MVKSRKYHKLIFKNEICIWSLVKNIYHAENCFYDQDNFIIILIFILKVNVNIFILCCYCYYLACEIYCKFN